MPPTRTLSLLCSPPHTHTECYTIYPNVLHFQPHYLAPVVLFNTIKRTGPSWEFRELPPLSPSLSSYVVQSWLRSSCEQSSLVPLIPGFCLHIGLVWIHLNLLNAMPLPLAATRPVSNFQDHSATWKQGSIHTYTCMHKEKSLKRLKGYHTTNDWNN